MDRLWMPMCGNVQNQFGWGLEQPGPMETVTIKGF